MINTDADEKSEEASTSPIAPSSWHSLQSVNPAVSDDAAPLLRPTMNRSVVAKLVDESVVKAAIDGISEVGLQATNGEVEREQQAADEVLELLYQRGPHRPIGDDEAEDKGAKDRVDADGISDEAASHDAGEDDAYVKVAD